MSNLESHSYLIVDHYGVEDDFNVKFREAQAVSIGTAAT